jgi:3-isopropylmalate/(R)-2-methylmalate dehydratase small subunit
MREAITTLVSSYVALPVADVDTDQIIPARFLTTTQRTGLGEHLFHDWRYDGKGAPKPEFILNRAESRGARVLVAGRNFGCGSSREHAVWALMDAGFRAVISASFADIFRGNALGNGLLPVQVDAAVADRLLQDAPTELTIDLESQTVTRGDNVLARFDIPAFAKHCLQRGIDELEFLLGASSQIEAYESAQGGTGAINPVRP